MQASKVCSMFSCTAYATFHLFWCTLFQSLCKVAQIGPIIEPTYDVVAPLKEKILHTEQRKDIACHTQCNNISYNKCKGEELKWRCAPIEPHHHAFLAPPSHGLVQPWLQGSTPLLPPSWSLPGCLQEP